MRDRIGFRDLIGWYEGPTLLHHLETVYVASDTNLTDLRFPVQYVVRPMSSERPDYRGYAGQVSAGRLRPGDVVDTLQHRGQCLRGQERVQR